VLPISKTGKGDVKPRTCVGYEKGLGWGSLPNGPNENGSLIQQGGGGKLTEL